MAAQTLQLGPAFEIAVQVHGLQMDGGGGCYLFHVVRVAEQMDTDEERVAALLHDAMEDCGSTSMASSIYHRIAIVYGNPIADAVAALTHVEGEDYMQYIRALSVNPLAAKVKMADLRENSREDRLAKLPSERAERLRTKYREAMHFLLTQPQIDEVSGARS